MAKSTLYDEWGNPVEDQPPFTGGVAPVGKTLPAPGTFVSYAPDGTATPMPTLGSIGQPQTEQPPPVTAGPLTETTASGGGGGGYSGGSLVDPFTQTFTPPSNYSTNANAYLPPTPNYTAPTFTPPAYTAPPAFQAPTYTPPPAWTPPADWSYADFVGPDAQTVLSRPGYDFRRRQGEQQLENNKAAQGLFGTGATGKALIGYNQDYASNEFQNEWNRDLTEYGTNRGNSLDAYNLGRANSLDAYNTNYKTQYTDPYALAYKSATDTYNTNYQTQYTDPYKFAYQGALDAFAPQMAGFNANVNAGNMAYQTQAAAGQHQNDENYTNAWNAYLFDYDKFRNQQNDTFQKQFSVMGL